MYSLLFFFLYSMLFFLEKCFVCVSFISMIWSINNTIRYRPREIVIHTMDLGRLLIDFAICKY